MAGMVGALYDRLEGYEEVAKCYGSLEEASMEEKLRGKQQERELETFRDAGIKLQKYFKQRFDRLFSAFQNACKRGDDCDVVLGKQEDWLAKIRDLEEEIKRLKTSLSEAIFADPEKIRRDVATVRASLETEYQQKINSPRHMLNSWVSQIMSIRDLRDAGAKKFQASTLRD